MTSSMDVIQNVTLTHGFTVIPRQQTKGSGRGQNAWLSPEGCLMFSLQLHVPLSSVLGSHVSLLQHLVAAAVVKGILELPGYEVSHQKSICYIFNSFFFLCHFIFIF